MTPAFFNRSAAAPAIDAVDLPPADLPPVDLPPVDLLPAEPSPAMLRRTLLEEMLRTRGVDPNGRLRRLIEPIGGRAIDHFLAIAIEFDRRVGEHGTLHAARWMLPRFVRGVEVAGDDQVPPEGPLLVLSNHPGSFDEIVIAATLPRHDLRVFANDHPILTSLPAVASRSVFSKAGDAHAAMAAVRNGIKNLRAGRTLLLFPNGRTDPDPRRTPGAREAFATWSPSIELILRKAPETQVVFSIVSGVVSPTVMRSPFLRLRRPVLERQKLAQMIQVAVQLFVPRLFRQLPRITFSPSFSIDDLTSGGAHGLHEGIVAHAQRMLDLHRDDGLAPRLLPLTP